jgi:hypothetical protein
MWRIPVALMAMFAVPVWGGGPAWQIGTPIQKGRLTIYPVTGGTQPVDPRYMTLDEGLETGVVKVGELGSLQAARMVRLPGATAARGDAARVNELALVNNSDRPLLLLAGEVVSGGKQDRVVSRDRIVPPHSAPVPLGVFCVEQGRWRGLTTEFAAAKLMAHPELRKQTVVAADQQKVWEEVAANREVMARAVGGAGAALGRPATTSYAVAAKESSVDNKVTEDAGSFLPRLPDDAVGMVVAVNGRLVWADIFPNAALFRRYRTKLLQSYVVESYRSASAAGPALTAADVQNFLRPLGGRQNIEVEPDLYRLVRSEAEGLVTFELESLSEKGAPRLHFARMVK